MDCVGVIGSNARPCGRFEDEALLVAMGSDPVGGGAEALPMTLGIEVSPTVVARAE